MEAVFEVDPLVEFFEAIRSPHTKRMYTKRLELFFNYILKQGSMKEKAREFSKKSKADPAWSTYVINDFMRFQKSRAENGEIAEATLSSFWKPVKLFCDQNDILLNWKKIRRKIPSGRQYANDRPPTREEILKILEYPDRRTKPFVLVLVSSGIRVGAFEYLRWKDIEPIDNKGEVVAARLKAYAGENDEYGTFCSGEAYRALKEWMELRAAHGEKISGDSWVARDLWAATSRVKGIASRGLATYPQKLSRIGVTRLVQRAIWSAGLRTGLEAGKKRYEFSALHSFRKFAKTAFERHMKSLSAEMLLGHDIGLHANYDRLPESDLLADYLRAVSELTFLEALPQAPSEEVETLKQEMQLREKQNTALLKKLLERLDKLERRNLKTHP